MANLMTVHPQATSAPKLSGSPKKTETKGEVASQQEEFAATLKKGLEKENEKKTDGNEQASIVALSQQALPLTAAAVKMPQADLSEKTEDETAKQDAVAKALNSKVSVKTDKEELAVLPAANKLIAGKKGDALAKTVNPTDAPVLDAKAQANATLAGVESPNNRQAQAAQLVQNQNTNGKVAPEVGVQAAMLQALQVPSDDSQFEVESLEVGKAGDRLDPSKKSSGAAQVSQAPVSKLSTNDYLSLRDISRKDAISNPIQGGEKQFDLGTFGKAATKKEKLDLNNLKEAGGTTVFAQNLTAPQHGRIVEAPTTQGTAGKTILAHDAIHQLTQQVNLMSAAKQDGEIKIRLRPDHLGEIQMSVKTQGQNVAIQIKAHDGEAKKIIEDSLSSLRSSLSEQNLVLSRVDVVTQAAPTQGGDQGLGMDLSGQRQNSGQEGFSSFQEQERNARQERLYEENTNPRNLNLARQARSARASASGGLDMIA